VCKRQVCVFCVSVGNGSLSAQTKLSTSRKSRRQEEVRVTDGNSCCHSLVFSQSPLVPLWQLVLIPVARQLQSATFFCRRLMQFLCCSEAKNASVSTTSFHCFSATPESVQQKRRARLLNCLLPLYFSLFSLFLSFYISFFAPLALGVCLVLLFTLSGFLFSFFDRNIWHIMQSPRRAPTSHSDSSPIDRQLHYIHRPGVRVSDSPGKAQGQVNDAFVLLDTLIASCQRI